MRRPASPKRPPVTGKSKPGRNPGQGCCALILIDGRPIREQARRDYDKTRRSMASTRAEIDQYVQRDLPAYLRWLNSNFGSLLTELRELQDKLARNEDLIGRIQTEAFFEGVSHATAYRQVMEDLERDSTASPKDNQDQGAHSAEDFFESNFGSADDGPKRAKRRGRSKTDPTPPPSRVKELYRALVRRLHPDTQTEMTAEKLEWWHQAQDAYQKGDEGQLEILLALCELDDQAPGKNTSVSLWQRIIRQLNSSLRQLKRKLAACKNDAAWRFTSRKDRAIMARTTKTALEQAASELRARLAATERALASFKSGRRHRKQSGPSIAEMLIGMELF